MHIDVWSDVVCPWCYLGARRLASAIDRFDGEVRVRWHAFQLDPSAPDDPRDLRSVIDRRFGPGAFVSMARRLEALGAAEGITYRFDLARWGNTFDAHRLVEWSATDAAAQQRLVDRLFRGYFSDGDDVTDHGSLLAAVEDVGLDHDEAAAVLAGGGFAGEVERDREAAVELGITGVPAFVLDRSFLVPGAQDTDRLVQLFERMAGRSAD